MSHRSTMGTAATTTVTAPANIALIKYWGAKDLERAVPVHPSISMTLRSCCSTSTVQYLPDSRGAGVGEIFRVLDDGSLQVPDREFRAPIEAHLGCILQWAGLDGSFKVATRNSFPMAAGLASSASGFAALTLAATGALGIEVSTRQASSLARLSGSGSAARSIVGGFVEWPAGTTDDECHAVQLAPAEHWDLRDVIALVESAAKPVSSRLGHARAATSPHYATRAKLVPRRLQTVREAIAQRSFDGLASIVEEDAIELHLITMSSIPPIFYWAPATLSVLKAIRELRAHGVPACFTMDAGANVHVICLPEAEEAVVTVLERVDGVEKIIRDAVGSGPRCGGESLL